MSLSFFRVSGVMHTPIIASISFEERKVRTVWDDEQEKWYFLKFRMYANQL